MFDRVSPTVRDDEDAVSEGPSGCPSYRYQYVTTTSLNTGLEAGARAERPIGPLNDEPKYVSATRPPHRSAGAAVPSG